MFSTSPLPEKGTIQAVDPAPVLRVQVWADGLGKWHASVPLTDSRAKDAHVARQAIIAELQERYAPNYDPRTLHITRERYTGHGTVIYGEIWT